MSGYDVASHRKLMNVVTRLATLKTPAFAGPCIQPSRIVPIWLLNAVKALNATSGRPARIHSRVSNVGVARRDSCGSDRLSNKAPVAKASANAVTLRAIAPGADSGCGRK